MIFLSVKQKPVFWKPFLLLASSYLVSECKRVRIMCHMSVAVLSLLGSVEVHYLSVTSRPTWPYKPIRFVRDTEQPFCLMIWCLFRLGWVIRVLSSEIPGEDCCKCWSKTWSDCFPLPGPQTSLSALCWKNKHGRNLDQFTVEKIQVPTVVRKSIHCFKEQRTRVFPHMLYILFPIFHLPH